MIRVLLADDQVMVRDGLKVILESADDIEVVGEASGGREVVRMAQQLRPDVACMDVRMPGGDGITATRELAGPDVKDPIPVLVITTFDLDDYIFGAVEAGASGFLLKDADPDLFVDAVQKIAHGEGIVAQSVTRRVLQEFARRRAPAPTDNPAIEGLTPRELEILALLTQGLSNVEIAARLFLEPSTVKSHLARINVKIDVRDRLQAVVWAFRNGLGERG